MYLDDYHNVPKRCPERSWLAMTLFLIYILMTSIMLINLLIAIFRFVVLFFHLRIFGCATFGRSHYSAGLRWVLLMLQH